MDRSNDPPGSWRTNSDLLLSPEVHARTKEAIGRVHDAEAHVSEDFLDVVRQSLPSAEAVGFKYRLKGEDRLKEKVAEALLRRPDTTAEEAVQDISDAIRYTVRFEHENYESGCQDVSERLQARGYEMYYRKNHWADPEYKGINTRWVTAEGQRFEIQFHTLESYHAKQEITHDAYERVRNPLTTRPEVAELETFQREVSSWVPVPDGAVNIPDFRRELL